MELDPDALTCSHCGEPITDSGYLPATDASGTYQPIPEAAVCGACGFNELGMTGCAPEPTDVFDSDTADVLLYVTVSDEGVERVSVKE
ncbi:hypothetical protein [Haloplanus halobius]|uniref:hypothetical protein n=1 Tax=Haloplanus halobius TaxID=2934938 RepID=UPI00200CEB91|nr:hypothetical protein [Haloplanus sp. XH21]